MPNKFQIPNSKNPNFLFLIICILNTDIYLVFAIWDLEFLTSLSDLCVLRGEYFIFSFSLPEKSLPHPSPKLFRG